MKAPRKKGGPFDKLRAVKAQLDAQERERATKKAPLPRPADPGGDDTLLRHRLYAGVTPLDRGRGRVTSQSIDRSAAAERAAERGARGAHEDADDEAVRAHLRALVEQGPDGGRFEVTDDGSRVEGRRVDLPIGTLRRLRRGEVPVDGRIDLHGMGLAAARQHLELFVRTMRARGERCLLVIHGKGRHSPGGLGVLRGEIAAWLSQGPAGESVAAFATAREQDGGEGAVYVLLRR